jgi:hypothetical protein
MWISHILILATKQNQVEKEVHQRRGNSIEEEDGQYDQKIVRYSLPENLHSAIHHSVLKSRSFYLLTCQTASNFYHYQKHNGTGGHIEIGNPNLLKQDSAKAKDDDVSTIFNTCSCLLLMQCCQLDVLFT